MNNPVRVQVFASGVVQGVNYRWFTIETAQSLGLFGWVKNLPDGRVEAEIEGETESVDQLLDAMRHGPRSAHVSGLEVIPLEYSGNYHDFRLAR